jgi:hypothetical protein
MLKTRFLLVTVVALLAIPTAAASALTLSDPAALPKSLPGTGQMQGGEPSLAFDPTGDGHLYSVAPGGNDNKGVNFWASPNGGNTWNYVRSVGSTAGGGDSDVDVGLDHKVYVLDLEVASSAVCRSTDFGKTFGDGCETGAAQDQAGAEEDRQWIVHDPNDANTTYFNYHDFTLEAPIIEKSTDGGSTYAPCGNLVDPAGSLFPSSLINTIVGKTAAGKDGMLYVPIAAPTPTQAASSGSPTPPYGQIVIAYHKGCNSDQFSNTTVYSNDGASFSNLFVSNAVGPDGALFVIASGKLDANGPYGTYLWVSRDKGKTFSKAPIHVNSSDLKTNVMPGVAAGNKPGQVVVGWYGSQNVATPDDTKGEWRYYLARSDDYGASWDRAAVTPSVFHYGDICTVGIVCSAGGNRNLLDFSSVGVDPKTGCATTIFPGDPFDTPDREASGNTDPAAAYISREACASSEGGTGSNGAVLGVAAGCHDRTPPVTTVGKRSRFTRKGITLRGVSRDRGCGRNGAGKVAHVSLAISRRVGKRCQWLQPKGGFSKTRSCTRKTYVQAKGTSKWTYRLKANLKKGTYAVVPRAIDSVGNLERPIRGSRQARHNHNRYLFKVR